MIKALREKFNQNFTKVKYDSYLQAINALHPGALDFRVAETPVFIPKYFTKAMTDACDSILEFIEDDHFMKLTEAGIPKNVFVPGNKNFSEFLIFDFGVCYDENGGYVPQLIEMQAFPSLFAYQTYMDEITVPYASVPENFSAYLGGLNKDLYRKAFKNILLKDCTPEEVILLEIYPHQQKTRIDFYCTETLTGIRTVCLSELIIEQDDVFYLRDGVKTKIKKIFNRLIFDDLHQQPDWQSLPDVRRPLNVDWIPHPNWFYRVSKYTLPYIQHPNIPESFFLNEIKQPINLKDYVLKPLFSFAGMGVIIDVTEEAINKIKNPEHYILQKKVTYAPVIETPDEPAKAEIRLFYFRDPDTGKYFPAHNLARLSKGKMIGTRYNKDKEWVGGTIAYFEQ
jgi:hypothetical protein